MIFGVSMRVFIDAGYFAPERFVELIFIIPLLFSPPPLPQGLSDAIVTG